MSFLDRFNSGVGRSIDAVGTTVSVIFGVFVTLFFSALFLAAMVGGVWAGWALGNAPIFWALAYLAGTWVAFAWIYEQYMQFIEDSWNVRLPKVINKAHLFTATIYSAVVVIAWLIGTNA